MNDGSATAQHPAIPTDDPQRHLAVARAEEDTTLPHVGLSGDTYTILLTGEDTAGRYALIDMHVPPGGGPPPPSRIGRADRGNMIEGRVRPQPRRRAPRARSWLWQSGRERPG